MKVLQVLTKAQVGGLETFAMNLLRASKNTDIQYDFIVHGDDIEFYEKEIISAGSKIYRLPPYKIYNHFNYVRQLKKFFREHPEYQIMHTHTYTYAAVQMAVAKKFGVKTISHAHSTSVAKNYKALVKTIYVKASRFYADYMCSCSKDAGVWMYGEKNIQKPNYSVINNAIDINKYLFNQYVRQIVRQELNIKDSTVVLGHIGRFLDVKNHDYLIDVFMEYSKLNNDSCLLLIGDGKLKNTIEEKVINLGISNQVKFLGVRNDVNRLLQAFDCLVMPSKYEGVPLTLIEAQASSTPIVMSSVITCDAILTDNVYKISLDEGAYEWAKLIKDKITCNKNKIDIIKVVENYSIEKIFDKMQAIYHSFLSI